MIVLNLYIYYIKKKNKIKLRTCQLRSIFAGIFVIHNFLRAFIVRPYFLFFFLVFLRKLKKKIDGSVCKGIITKFIDESLVRISEVDPFYDVTLCEGCDTSIRRKLYKIYYTYVSYF